MSICVVLVPFYDFSDLFHIPLYTNNYCIRPCGPMGRALDFDASEPGSILVGYEIFLSFIFCDLFYFMKLFGALSIRHTYVSNINQVGLDSYQAITIDLI